MKRWYANVGEKLKICAIWTFIVEAIASMIAGIAVLADSYGDTETLIGLGLIFVGPLVAFVSSWVLYAFGQLVSDNHKLVVAQTGYDDDYSF